MIVLVSVWFPDCPFRSSWLICPGLDVYTVSDVFLAIKV